jgi:hypothetical protein
LLAQSGLNERRFGGFDWSAQHTNLLAKMGVWTQADLAAAAKIALPAVKRCETGVRTPIPAIMVASRLAIEDAGVEFILAKSGKGVVCGCERANIGNYFFASFRSKLIEEIQAHRKRDGSQMLRVRRHWVSQGKATGPARP